MTQVSEAPVSHLRRLWLYGVGGLAMVFLLLPTVIVVPMSFSDSIFLEFPPAHWSLRWYDAYFGSIEWRAATLTSLQVALLTVLLATPLGTAAAYGLHVSKARTAHLVVVVLAMPMMVPIILISIGVFYLYAKLALLQTIPGLVLAHSALALPFVVLLVTAGLKSFDLNQERVAQSLGASRLRAVLTVTIPQLRSSVVSSALLAFLTSFDEVVVAFFISGGDHATITRLMFSSLRDQVDPIIAAISTILVLLSVVVVLVVQMLIAPKKADAWPALATRRKAEADR
jgi:putative spermidine/putrescine transport system permease protein